MNPTIVTALSGEPKTGKTHLALSWPEPILVQSFDHGTGPLLRKFPGKAIEVKEYDLPLIETAKPTAMPKEIWKNFIKDFREAHSSGKYQTIVVDTATTAYELNRHAYCQEQGQRNLLREQYGEVYARMNPLFQLSWSSGVNVVLIHYLREKWVDEKNTGQLELDGYKRTEGLVDVVLETRRVDRMIAGKPKNVVMTKIKDNRFDLDINGLELENASYAGLMALIVGG